MCRCFMETVLGSATNEWSFNGLVSLSSRHKLEKVNFFDRLCKVIYQNTIGIHRFLGVEHFC